MQGKKISFTIHNFKFKYVTTLSRIESYMQCVQWGEAGGGGGGKGHYIWGKSRFFFSFTLGRAILNKLPLRGGLRYFFETGIYHVC